MANENHASYTKVGLTLVLGLMAVAGALIYFGGLRGSQGQFYAESYYSAPITGLSVGSEVNFRGVKVGEVKEISFIGAKYPDCDPKDMQIVYLKLAFDNEFLKMARTGNPRFFLEELVRQGLRATVTASGVTGLSKLALNLPKEGQEIEPPDPTPWNPELVCIPPKPSMLESFSDTATLLVNRIKRLDVASAWSNVTTVASSLARISENVDGLVESQKASIDSILTNLDDTARTLKDLVDMLRDNPSLLLRANDPKPLELK